VPEEDEQGENDTQGAQEPGFGPGCAGKQEEDPGKSRGRGARGDSHRFRRREGEEPHGESRGGDEGRKSGHGPRGGGYAFSSLEGKVRSVDVAEYGRGGEGDLEENRGQARFHQPGKKKRGKSALCEVEKECRGEETTSADAGEIRRSHVAASVFPYIHPTDELSQEEAERNSSQEIGGRKR